jgi:hypothetical protein
MAYYNNTSNYIIATVLFLILLFLVGREFYVITYPKNKNVSYVNVTESPEVDLNAHIKIYGNNKVVDNAVRILNETTKAPKKTDDRDQVYNLSENVYTYGDAKLACKAMGAKMATIDQVVDAYKQGANWCNYGWSNDQMALFPIQKENWNKMKNKKSCGFPGVNGGYFKNDKFLFGANCYGPKPTPKAGENVMEYTEQKQQQYNTGKLYGYKNKLPKVAPFASGKWSRYEA